MQVQPYERLSRAYDEGWGQFSLKYLDLVSELLTEQGVSPGRVLDLACGTGALAVELGKRGHEVVGVDLSPAMVRVARDKAAGLTGVTFSVQDMTRLSVIGQFDVVSCTFDSVNYVVEFDELCEMFRRVESVLATDGRFVFDSNTERLYQLHHRGTHKRRMGGDDFLHVCEYDRKRKLAVTRFEFTDGSVEVHHQRPYGVAELEKALSDAGMRLMSAWSDFDRCECDNDTQKAICIAGRWGRATGLTIPGR